MRTGGRSPARTPVSVRRNRPRGVPHAPSPKTRLARRAAARPRDGRRAGRPARRPTVHERSHPRVREEEDRPGPDRGRSAKCRRGESSVTWNSQGARGPEGAPGPPARKAPPVPPERPARRATPVPLVPAGPPAPQDRPDRQAQPARRCPSLESLNGVGCHLAGAPGTATLTYDADGIATLKCVPSSGGSSAQIRVNEFMTGSTGAASNEFVELVNAGSSAADVGGFKVAYRSSAGTSDTTLATIPAGTSIPAGGFYLLAGSGYLGSHTADQSFSASLASTGGGVAVRDTTGDDPRLGRLGRHDERLRRGPCDDRTADDRGSGQQLGPDPRRRRHERQRGRLLGQRDALPRRREPLGTTGGRRFRCRPPITPTGHARPESPTDTASAGHTPRMAYSQTAETAAIGLIEQHTLERLLSPELMLVDAELAERARALLREPHETNGKGTYMSALGTHEFTAGTSLGLEPPLSPPVVRGPVASAMPVGDGGLSELPTPPPAIRPPEAAPAIPAPAPAPAPVQAEVPQQPEPAAAPAPAPAPVPAPAPAPVQVEPELPSMAPGRPSSRLLPWSTTSPPMPRRRSPLPRSCPRLRRLLRPSPSPPRRSSSSRSR